MKLLLHFFVMELLTYKKKKKSHNVCTVWAYTASHFLMTSPCIYVGVEQWEELSNPLTE